MFIYKNYININFKNIIFNDINNNKFYSIIGPDLYFSIYEDNRYRKIKEII